MKEKTKELIQTYALIILGTFIMSIGFVVFISPLKLAPGGVYGIAIILHHVFNFPIGLSGICLDLPLLLIGTLWLGPKFGAKTLVGVITLPAFISLWEKVYGYAPLIGLPGDPMTPDPAAAFIVALCGGVIIGIGLGLIFRTRATSGGTDIIAMIIGKYVKHIPLGTILICVDSTIVLIALVAFKDWTVPLYSWLVIYVTGIVMDKVIAGFHGNKAVLILRRAGPRRHLPQRRGHVQPRREEDHLHLHLPQTAARAHPLRPRNRRQSLRDNPGCLRDVRIRFQLVKREGVELKWLRFDL